jgi:hypothetical protein
MTDTATARTTAKANATPEATGTATQHGTATRTQPSRLRIVGRWIISFAGFPLGGAAALLTVGPVDTTGSAAVGGLVTGAVLGAVQGWAMRADRRLFLLWTLATAAGLAVGLAVGSTLVDFGTDLSDLVLQGALSGLALGAAQAATVIRRTGPRTLFWPVWLAGVWAAAWTVSTSIGIQVGDQFTVFGSSGAITATLLTAGLPFVVKNATNGTQS